MAAAAVVLTRLSAEIRGGEPDPVKERRAMKFIALTFFALAAYVIFEGARDLLGGEAPDTSIVGIVLTGASIIIMPWLARRQRKAGQEMNSRLVIADGAETKLCAWLSVSTFAGLVAYAAFGWTWLDPVAGFIIAAFAVMEGKELGKANSSKTMTMTTDLHDDRCFDRRGTGERTEVMPVSR